MSAFVEAFGEKYEAAALKLSDGKTIRTIAENLFWFLVLLSWLPVIAGFVGFVDNFIPGRWGPAKPTHWLAVPVDHVFLVIAAVITIIAACLRRPVLLLCAIAPLLANFLGKAGLPGLGHPGFNLSIAYLAAFVVSFALFAWSAHLRTSYVASFFVICFWETSIQLFNEGWTWIENWFAAYEVETPQVHGQTILHNVLKEYSASESDFIVFLVCLLFARFLALFWKQNRELAARLLDLGTPVLLSEYIWPACKIWWPMPVVFVVFGLWLYPMLTDQFAMEVAIIIQDDLINEKKYPIKRVEQPELEGMVRHLIDYNEIALTNEAKASINAMQLNAVKTSDDLKTKIYPKLEQEVFPPRMPGTRTHRCGRSLSCLGSNAVKSAANSGYRKLRDPPLSVTKKISRPCTQRSVRTARVSRRRRQRL